MKLYSVRSNARRAARQAGLNPNLVVPAPGGFVISESKVAKGGDKKREILRSMLLAGWQRMPSLMSALGWQAHTVRGAISTLAKAEKLTIERKREAGVTSYRAVLPTDEAGEGLTEKSEDDSSALVAA